MRIATKLIISLYVVFIILAGIVSLLMWSLERSNSNFLRCHSAHSQFREAQESNLHMTRQLKEVSDFLLIGEEEIEKFEEFGKPVIEDFDEWERLVKEEGAFVEAAKAEKELETIGTLRQIYEEILKECDEIFNLERAGKHEEAIRILEDSIEVKYDEKLAVLLEKVIEDEKAECHKADRDVAKFSSFARTIGWASIGFAFLFAICVSMAVTIADASDPRLQKPTRILSRKDQGK